MNYKNALVALAATLTLGVSPALTSVNASTNAKETTKTTKKAETKKATKKTTSKKSTKKTTKKSTTPKVTSKYWQTPHYIEVTKNTTAIKNKLVTKNGQKYLTPTKKTINIKKGSKAFLYRPSGASTWTYLVVGKNKQATYYMVSSKSAINSTNWFKLTSATTTNNSSSNNNSSNNTNNSSSNNNSTQNKKTVVTVKSNYQVAQNDKFNADNYTDGYISTYASPITASGGIILQPGQKYQVKINSSNSNSQQVAYQINVNNQVIQITDSATSPLINPYNVTYGTNNSNGKYIQSTYAPNSSDAVVPKGFTPTNNFNWFQTDSTGSKIVKFYIYSQQANAWIQGTVSNNQFVPDYNN